MGVLPFPLARRRDFVRRQAAWYLEQTEGAAESNLRRQLDLQHGVLLRRGVAEEAAADQIATLEAAIRLQVLKASRGGAA